MTDTGPTEDQIVEESGTGNQITRVLQTPDGHLLWQRSPGRDNTENYPPLPTGALALLRALDTPTLRFEPPAHATPRLHTWHVHGRSSFAALMTPAQHDSDGTLHHLITTLGQQLGRLHEMPLPPDDEGELPPVPLSHLRLQRYLRTGRGPRAAPAFHYRLRTQLGSARFHRLQEATATLSTAPHPRNATLLHGWCSLGSLVVPDPPGRQPAPLPGRAAHLLTGSELATGHRESDLSCLLGELTEYAAAARDAGIDWPLPDQLRTAFLKAYGDRFDPTLLGAGITVRIGTHALAVAAFHGWNDQLHGYIPMLAQLLDHDEHTTSTS